jgi:hypothetical protein
MARRTDGNPTWQSAKCGATNRQGRPCGNVAGFGTDHVGFGRCKFHGGSSPDGRTFAAKQAAAAEAARLGAAVDTDPAEALSLCVSLVSGEVAWLRQRVEAIEDGNGFERGELHPAVRALDGAIDRLSRISKLAVDAGVEERRLELDELVVARLAEAVRAALAEVELSPEQHEQLRAAMTRHLAALDGIEWRRPRELTS